MENWNKWLIISGIVSVICGVGATIIYVGSLVYCEPIWYNPLGEKMGNIVQ